MCQSTCIAPIGILTLAGALSSLAAPNYLVPLHSVTFDNQVFSTYQVPKWSVGSLIFRGRPSYASSGPNLAVLGRDGGVILQTKVWFPDSYRVYVLDGSANARGEVLASASVLRNDGTVAHVLAIYARSGTVERVIPTNPLVPSYVCFGPKDEIWTFGIDSAAVAAGRDRDLLQRYDRSGKLLGSSLAIEQVIAGSQGAYGATVLGATSQQVWLFVGATGEWLDVLPDGSVAARLKPLPAHAGQQLSNAAMTESGAVFARMSGAEIGGLYRLDRADARWVPVIEWNANSQEERSINLEHFYGVDGDSLVFGTGPVSTLSWFRLPDAAPVSPR